MADGKLLKKLSAETRTKLRSTQTLTSLPAVISELLQNAIDAEASQIDIGVDCAEWGCWVADNGSGFTKDGLHKIGQGSECGWYNSSKAYTPASLETVSTFGFRGEALASMANLSCMEISSRTARSRESWSVIVKAGKSLYMGPSIRWRRESSGTVVSIRDAFFSLPVRRQSHPTPNKTIELIQQELEACALMFPNISFSLQDASKTKESRDPHKSHILKIPKTSSALAAFRHIYGRAFTEEKIAAISGQLQIEGFISLVGAHTKSYQFLYINKHPVLFCDLHRLIDNHFAASTFAKHAYDEGGETSLRSSARRSPRKGEKRPVYVLNLVIPVKHIDNCLEPSKSAIELDNKNVVTSFLSTTIHSFLVHHNFAPDKRRNKNVEGSARKKRKPVPENSTKSRIPSGLIQSERSRTPYLSDHVGKMPVADVQEMVWEGPSIEETFIMDNPTGNSYPQSTRLTVGADGPIEASTETRNLRTLQLTTEGNIHNKNNTGLDRIPDWLREALQANDAFALKEPRILSLSLLMNQDNDYRSSQLRHSWHTDCPTHRTISSRYLQPGSSSLIASQIRFRKDDLRKAQIISQVDCKFIACVIALDHDDPLGVEKDDETCNVKVPVDGRVLILIDQHAADERVRVERLLKSICRGFLGHQEGSGGVQTKRLFPPVPVLLTRHEASRLAELSDFQKAFELWGFRFSGLEETRSRLGHHESELDDGYFQVFVSAIPEIVSEKLLLGKEMQELIKGYIGALESRELQPPEPSSQHDDGSLDKETQWLKALRWCPRGLLDLVNSKACRGAIMFNDPLNAEQCERLVKQLSATIFPFQCAHGSVYYLLSSRPSLVPLTRLTSKSGGAKGTGLEWENVAGL